MQYVGMQLHLVSFGGPTDNYVKAVERLRSQAIQMNVFSSIHIYTHRDLLADPDFMFKDFVQNNPRGYGYWIWKAYYIQKVLQQIPEGDLLMYLDAGCELNPYGKRRLFELVPIVCANHIIGTHSISNDIAYTKWATREAMCNTYGLSIDYNRLMKNHMQAGYLFMQNNLTIRTLIHNWNLWNTRIELLDDTLNNEMPEFVDHRHDQSIFNILVKSAGLHNYDAEPADVRINNPVWYCRNRNGTGLNIEYPY